MIKYLLVLFLLVGIAFAQDSEKGEAQLEITPEQERKDLLLLYRSEIIALSSQIRKIEKELDSDIEMMTRIQSEAQLVRLKKEYRLKRFEYIAALSGVDLFENESEKQTTFSDDIKQILDPVLQTFKKISEKPRKIQELTDEQFKIDTKLEKAKEAREAIEDFIKDNKDRRLKTANGKSLAIVKGIIEDLEKRSNGLKFKRNLIEENEENIVSTFSGIIFDFIKTKGKNLVLAMLIFGLVYWGFKYGQDKILNLLTYNLQRSDRRDIYEWLIRPTRVIYSVLTFLFAFFMSILTLYVLNDWILVTIILITFAALIWSSKQYFPQFFETSKIVLNLGAVREGERVFYNGLPWKIKSLGYYCRLINPDLEGGYLRINTKELLNANSRKINPSEPWFPTRKGDWIQTENLFGQVTLQTPEMVVVDTVGGESHYFTATDFYDLQVRNLSEGFSIEIIYGLDYSHQAKLLDIIIPSLREILPEKLMNDFPQVKQSMKQNSVEFHQAGASSLDMRIFFKFSGELAHMKQIMTRRIQSYMVEFCNEHKYTIPFNQLTVHMQQ